MRSGSGVVFDTEHILLDIWCLLSSIPALQGTTESGLAAVLKKGPVDVQLD